MTQTAQTYIREESFFEKLIRSKAFWLISTLVLFSYPIYRSMQRPLPPELPVLFELPEFNLTNQEGKPFGSKDLKGRFYIASFFFTSCPTVCPKIMETTQRIQKRVRNLGQAVALVSFTVDPEVDTPEVLFKYSRKLKSNPFIWSFLTGSQKDLEDVLVRGFKVAMGEKEPGDLYDISHSERFVLVDHLGRVRGIYGKDRVEVDQMMIDLGLLANRAKMGPQL